MRKKDIDSKIIFALERICNALRVLTWNKVKEINLSPIQLQFLLYLKRYPKAMRTVSNISAEFKLTKATVCDSLNTLERKKLILKKKDVKDRRVTIINLTKKGEKITKSLDGINKPLKRILENFSEEEKEKTFSFFVKLIDFMRREGILKVARICISCSHFREITTNEGKQYFCELTNKSFKDNEIQIDCLFHSPAYL